VRNLRWCIFWDHDGYSIFMVWNFHALYFYWKLLWLQETPNWRSNENKQNSQENSRTSLAHATRFLRTHCGILLFSILTFIWMNQLYNILGFFWILFFYPAFHLCWDHHFSLLFPALHWRLPPMVESIYDYMLFNTQLVYVNKKKNVSPVKDIHAKQKTRWSRNVASCDA